MRKLNLDHFQSEPRKLINLFFDGNIFKKEELRLFVKDNLEKILKIMEDNLHHSDRQSFWHQINDHCQSQKEHSSCSRAYQEIINLPEKAKFWLKEAVESPERMEFFILSKAAEIASGDKDQDYYHAQFIRHDQLLAALLIMQQALTRINKICDMTVEQIEKSAEFEFFARKDIESRIYEKAEQFFQIRQDMGVLGKV